MRIAFITHYDQLYGANRSLLDLIAGLSAHGVLSHVIAPQHGPLTEALRARAIPYGVAPIQKWMLSYRPDPVDSPLQLLRRGYYQVLAGGRLARNLACLPALTKRLRDWEIDVVYTNSLVTPAGMLLAGAARRPHVWHIREYDSPDFPLHADWGGRFSRRLAQGTATALIANSRATLAANFGPTAPAKAHVIYNGVLPLAEFDRLRVGGTSSSARPFTFALIGLLHPGKGQAEAIHALALLTEEHPHVRLVLAGSGNQAYVQELRQLVTELGVAERVAFLGYVADPFAVYEQADAALTCSRHEGMGRTTAEAMAAGLPVIGYDGGGTPEVIDDGQTGLLYRGGAAELAQAMSRFVAAPEWAAQLGENGWAVARERFSIERYAQEIFEVLQKLVQS